MQGFFRLCEGKFKTFLNTFLRPSKKKKGFTIFVTIHLQETQNDLGR